MHRSSGKLRSTCITHSLHLVLMTGGTASPSRPEVLDAIKSQTLENSVLTNEADSGLTLPLVYNLALLDHYVCWDFHLLSNLTISGAVVSFFPLFCVY